MKTLAKFIGKLPFTGKVMIKSQIFSLYQDITAGERQESYWKLLGFLLLNIFLHFGQMMLGIQALGFNSPIWVKIVSALYAITNLAVVLTQAHLIHRVNCFSAKKSYSRSERSYMEPTNAESLTMMAITLGGQVIFLSQYFRYK